MDKITWYRLQNNLAGITSDASATTGAEHSLASSDGISLCIFSDDVENTTADPTVNSAQEVFKANGIRISNWNLLDSNNTPYALEAWPMQSPCIHIVHDGTTSSDTYAEDSEFDLKDLGVGTGWVAYNFDNDNYAFVKSVEYVADNGNYSRIYLATDKAGNNATTAADIDTDDDLYLFPYSAAQYPLSDIGLMT